MEKFFIFMSEQWLLVTAIAAACFALAWLENRRAGTSLSPHALTALVNAEGALIVDLREKPDFDNGHIVDAINLPYSKWQSQQSSGSTELDDKQGKPLILVCKMGQQATAVARKLSASGHPSVYRLSGGLMEWQGAQMPLVKS